ncbi:DUF2017 family protein [uncultured Schumannella sp.]|uniref:DUF2017 family protein n=1 Tax=uncultured Schumannella sp. TaxID=1195956 RepID=UPI0025F6F2E6|nr:DUF2017 family protein [uncultured Schumannella sp.]
MSIDVQVVREGGRPELEVRLGEPELALLRSLLEQFMSLVRDDSGTDPALRRLFPAGYRDDPDAAAEFEQYTRAGLVERKSSAAASLLRAIEDDAVLRAPADTIERWLPVFTDLRAVLAERLGIHHDGDHGDGLMGEVYDWLGAFQWNLVEAVDEIAEGGR